MTFRSIYAAFDRYPSAKGAATHIEQASAALFAHESAGPGALWVLDPGDVQAGDEAGQLSPAGEFNGRRFAVDAQRPHLLERAEYFAAAIGDWLEQQADGQVRIGQFRDPWSGVPMIRSGKIDRLVYEVNALPSIEMPYRYPHLGRAVLAKLRHLENFCLDGCDHIITPSAQTRHYLLDERGIGGEKVSVVPNGAEPAPRRDRPDAAPAGDYLIYFGALQPWQGIATLLHAFAQLSDLADLRLVLCSSHKERLAAPHRQLAERLGIADRLVWRFQLPRVELQAWIQHAVAGVAPLADTPRNTAQGCCPLKVVESLGAGTAVVASDLPVVRDLVDHLSGGGGALQEGGVLLARADRPAEFALALRKLLDDPQQAIELGRRGRESMEARLTWDWHRQQLAQIYTAFCGTADEVTNKGTVL